MMNTGTKKRLSWLLTLGLVLILVLALSLPAIAESEGPLVLGTESDSGTGWSYDYDSASGGTLNITDNVTLTGTSDVNSGAGIYAPQSLGALTINIAEGKTLTVNGADSTTNRYAEGISLSGVNLKITGGGTLTVTSGTYLNPAGGNGTIHGIACSLFEVGEDTTVNITAPDIAKGTVYAMYCGDLITVGENAVLNVTAGTSTGNSYAVYGGALTIATGASVTATADTAGTGARNESGGVNLWYALTVNGTGSLVARGDTYAVAAVPINGSATGSANKGEDVGNFAPTYIVEIDEYYHYVFMDAAGATLAKAAKVAAPAPTPVPFVAGTAAQQGEGWTYTCREEEDGDWTYYYGTLNINDNVTFTGTAATNGYGISGFSDYSQNIYVEDLEINIAAGKTLAVTGIDAQFPAGIEIDHLTVAGPGNLVVTGGDSTYGHAYGIECYWLTIKGGAQVTATAGVAGTGNESYGVCAWNGLIVEKGRLTATGNDAAIFVERGGDYAIEAWGATIKGAATTSGTLATATTKEYTVGDSYTVIAIGDDVCKLAEINAVKRCYPLWIEGNIVNEDNMTTDEYVLSTQIIDGDRVLELEIIGSPTWNGEANTMYGSGLCAMQGLILTIGEGQTLTIIGAANNVPEIRDGIEGTIATGVYGEMLIQGGGTLRTSGGVAPENTYGGSAGAFGYFMLQPDGTKLIASGKTLAAMAEIEPIVDGAVIAGQISANENGTNPTPYVDEDSLFGAKWASLSAVAAPPDIWVGGVRVNDFNAADVLGDGKVKYNAETKTLTLTNATINAVTSADWAGYDFEGFPRAEARALGIFASGDLTLNLVGSSTIRASAVEGVFNCCGVCIYEGDLTVTGAGTLNIPAGAGGQMFYVAMAVDQGNAFIQSGTLNLTGSYGGLHAYYDVYSEGYSPTTHGRIMMSGGAVNAVAFGAEFSFAYACQGDFTVTGTTADFTADALFGIYSDGGLITIEGGHTIVNVDGFAPNQTEWVGDFFRGYGLVTCENGKLTRVNVNGLIGWFYADGVEPLVTLCPVGDAITLPTLPAGVVPQGKVLGGWYTEPAGEGVRVTNSTVLTSAMIDNNEGALLLFANWIDAPPPSSGRGAPRFSPTIPTPDNGKVNVSNQQPKAGDTVTVTLTPDEGYGPGGITVTDQNGKKVPVTDLGNGKYSFRQPEGKVTIEADFVPLASGRTYSDVRPGDWFYKYVMDLTEAGVVDGYPNGTFLPKGQVTYGETLKLIMKAVGYEDQAATGQHWASGYLDKAIADGLISGVVDLDAPIDRLSVAEIAARALKLDLADVPATSPFADCDSSAALALYQAGIIEGSIDEAGQRLYKPNDTITRAEISAIVWRIMQD